MRSIPLTRYNQPRSFRAAEKKRCSDIYVLLKRQQACVEESYKGLLPNDRFVNLAMSHLQTGNILRHFNLHTLAADQFMRALQLLSMFNH